MYTKLIRDGIVIDRRISKEGAKILNHSEVSGSGWILIHREINMWYSKMYIVDTIREFFSSRK